MKTVILGLFMVLVASPSWAATCRMNLVDINKIVVANESKQHQAHAKAMEKCVDLRAAKYKQTRGEDPDEERYAMMIDSCSLQRCEGN